MTQISDATFTDLLAVARQGDDGAWGQLVELVLPHLRQRLDREPEHGSADGADHLQEALITAKKQLSQFQGNTLSKFVSWLDAIWRNKAKDRNRIRARRDELMEVNLDRIHQLQPKTPSEVAIRKEQIEAARKAIKQLDPIDREIIQLRDFDELDYETIADALECTEEAARKRHYRALKRLGLALGDPS